MTRPLLGWIVAAGLSWLGASAWAADSAAWLSPTALAAAPDGKTLYIAAATSKKILVFDLPSRQVVRTYALPAPASGLALSADGTRLAVTCPGPASSLCLLDSSTGKQLASIGTGHTAMAPVLSADGRRAFVCCRFNNCVAVVDLNSRREVSRIPVAREPVAAALTPDGKQLLVANHLHAGRSDVDEVAAVVSVIDTAAGKVIKELRLPNGSGVLNELRISPDGRFAVVTHLLARFHLPTSQLERGWMNTNAETLIDLANLTILNTVLLDNVESGAANPWGIAWSADSRSLLVAHAGTHELSVIDFPALVAKLRTTPAVSPEPMYGSGASDVVNDLAFLVGLRERVKLPPGDRGPRAVLICGQTAVAANYYSDTLSLVDLGAGRKQAESVALGTPPPMDIVRQGEVYFHDAGLCFQGWQSCASCHPGDGRVDALNWDLLNDGIGNPKNNKSLLLSHRTPPAMSLGIRETAETAVRSGIRHILFTVQPESVPTAIDEYLKTLKPVPSPFLVEGKLSASAARGEKLFKRAGCASCHPPGLFTDRQSYDIGTKGRFDQGETRFDTPTLVEVWRTAPYLHDGSAATVREVITEHNHQDQHGQTSTLSTKEIEDLCAYVLSL